MDQALQNVGILPHLNRAALEELCQDEENIREAQSASHIHHKEQTPLLEGVLGFGFLFLFLFFFYTLTHQPESWECCLPPISDLHPGEIGNTENEKREILPSAEQQETLEGALFEFNIKKTSIHILTTMVFY